jgi:hypothetical protein
MFLDVILAVGKGIRLKLDDPGYIVASGFAPVIIALLVAGIFLVFKRFRNRKSFIAVVFAVSILGFLGSIGNPSQPPH